MLCAECYELEYSKSGNIAYRHHKSCKFSESRSCTKSRLHVLVVSIHILYRNSLSINLFFYSDSDSDVPLIRGVMF